MLLALRGGGRVVLEAGIDEAGRGPVLGPLVMACVVLDDRRVATLKGYVKDSKKLSARQRSWLYSLIMKLALEVKVRVVEPFEIDDAVLHYERGLNELEAIIAAGLIDSLSTPVERVYIDSPDPIPQRYAEIVRRYLRSKRTEVVALNKAEDLYVQAAAASIIAKVERDKAINELKEIYGDFGSGYPSDPKTREFISRILKEGADLPPIVRKSWRTLLKFK